MSGELARGYLDVYYSSADYWSSDPGDIPSPDYGIAAAVIALDAGGYLVGWGMAVWNEIFETGDLDRENEWKRINKGAQTAVAASFLRYIGIKFPGLS